MEQKHDGVPMGNGIFENMIKPVLVLAVISVVCAALLAWLNKETAPLIAENERIATQNAFLSVLPEGTPADSLETLAVSWEGVESAVRTKEGLAAVKAAAPGYSGKDVTVYVAFDEKGAISGLQIDASTQTAGIGSKAGEPSYAERFLGWDQGEVSEGAPADAISGATYSSKAVLQAVNQAVDCYENEIKGA